MQYIKSIYPKLQFLDPIHFEGISITPIDSLSIRDSEHILEPLLDLETAFQAKLVSIKELGSNGSVEEVIVINQADLPLIILEGQGLEGAKQNRVLQKTVVIPAKTSLEVPVNCVERGRWQYNSDEFRPASFSAGPNVKMRKANAMKSGDYSVQSQVWEGVAELSYSLECHSGTENLGEVLSQASSKSHFNKYALEKLIHSFDGYGFKVSGGRFEFFEVYGRKSWAKAALKRSVMEWVLDSTRVRESKPLKLSILDSDWLPKRSVGLEKSFLAMQGCTGLSSEYKNSLLHLFCAPEDSAMQKHQRMPIFDVE
jgi:hypothetical protein